METTFKKYKHLVLNIPHSSTNIPAKFLPCWGFDGFVTDVRTKEEYLHVYHFNNIPDNTNRWAEYYFEQSKPLIDFYTDDLFNCDDSRITSIICNICRTLCDVERMVNDPLEKEGYGIISKRMFKGKNSVPRVGLVNCSYKPDFLELYEYYMTYQHDLSMVLLRNSHHTYQRYRRVLLIDCHSFSSSPTVLCNPRKTGKQVDICIGYNDDATRPEKEIIDFVATYFENLGYTVGHNTPFSNSKTVPCPLPYHSLMMEINKHCYMNEKTLEKTKDFYTLQNNIRHLYDLLLDDGKNGVNSGWERVYNGY